MVITLNGKVLVPLKYVFIVTPTYESLFFRENIM